MKFLLGISSRNAIWIISFVSKIILSRKNMLTKMAHYFLISEIFTKYNLENSNFAENNIFEIYFKYNFASFRAESSMYAYFFSESFLHFGFGSQFLSSLSI